MHHVIGKVGYTKSFGHFAVSGLRMKTLDTVIIKYWLGFYNVYWEEKNKFLTLKSFFINHHSIKTNHQTIESSTTILQFFFVLFYLLDKCWLQQKLEDCTKFYIQQNFLDKAYISLRFTFFTLLENSMYSKDSEILRGLDLFRPSSF